MTLVKIPVALRRHTGGAARVEASGATVGGCLGSLESRFPMLSGELRDEAGNLLPSVSLYVNGENVLYLSGLETALAEGDELAIVLAIAGGAVCSEWQESRGTGMACSCESSLPCCCRRER